MKYEILCKKYAEKNGENYYFCKKATNEVIPESYCINSNCENVIFKKELSDDAMLREVENLKLEIQAIKHSNDKITDGFIRNEERLHNLLNERRNVIKYLENKLRELIIENERLKRSSEEIS